MSFNARMSNAFRSQSSIGRVTAGAIPQQYCCDIAFHPVIVAQRADPLPEFDPNQPLELASSIDRTISQMRKQAVHPAFDRTKSLSERAQYLPEAPASAGYDPNQAHKRATVDVAWLPYMSTKERLASWIEPSSQADASDKRSLYKQMSKDERG